MPLYSHGTTYNLHDLIPQDWREWDNYWSRLNRYEIFSGYYHNIAYHSIVTYSQALKVQERLYKHVRGVYNPVKRLCEGYVSKVYGGMLDIQTAEKGAIQIETDDDRLRDAIVQLWMASKWGQKKSLYVRHGAMQGDSFLKIVDDIHRQEVRLEVVDAGKIKTLETNDAGGIEFVELEYYIPSPDTRTNRMVKYNETISKDEFVIQVDGKVSTMHTNGRNEPVSQWDNPYGFIPLVHVQHMDMGLMYGAPAIYGSMHKINELNDLASILNDGMRKQVQMPLVFKNARVDELDMGADQSSNTFQRDDTPRKDTVTALNISGENADVITLTPTIDITAGLENIREVVNELEKDLPELALHRLRDSGNLTAPGVRSAYDDAIARYQEARGNYDTGLIDAQKMAVAIGGMRGYDGYSGFNLMSLDNGTLEHQIASRPVINDSLGLREQLEMTIQGMSSSAPKIFFIKAGWSDDEADEIVEASENSRNQSLMSNPFGQFDTLTETPPPDGEDETPQDAFDTRLNTGMNEVDISEAQALLATA